MWLRCIDYASKMLFLSCRWCCRSSKRTILQSTGQRSATLAFRINECFCPFFKIILFFCKTVHCLQLHMKPSSDDRLGINVSTAKNNNSALKHGNLNSGNNTPERLCGVTLRLRSWSQPFYMPTPLQLCLLKLILLHLYNHFYVLKYIQYYNYSSGSLE